MEVKQEIIKAFTLTIAAMDLKIVNVIIDKTKFRDNNYHILENALKYNIQHIENDSDGQWNYILYRYVILCHSLFIYTLGWNIGMRHYQIVFRM